MMDDDDDENCKRVKVLCINFIFVRVMKSQPVRNFVRLDPAGEIQKFHCSIFWKTLF